MAERTIVDVANYLKSHGLTPAEHPLFGGVGGGHVAGSYHYSKDKDGIQYVNAKGPYEKCLIITKDKNGNLTYLDKNSPNYYSYHFLYINK